eukprot:gnl/Chilomastix_caulleri/1673.p1 GENE.gnl/Chilomastix_caulleri/1673~~gnl/Chilomastix_caulleri/1673.p1  ORF type:complete len:148 (+),score=9.48 gnl/Chilomastix_caulleri/1673:54-497(+)
MDALPKEQVTSLLEKAIEASKNSYSPYSKYPVGAALITDDGHIFTGCNVENASYGLSICAERNAICKMVSEGFRTIKAIACVTKDCGLPCGMCRQFINEFSPDCIVISGTISGELKEFIDCQRYWLMHSALRTLNNYLQFYSLIELS